MDTYQVIDGEPWSSRFEKLAGLKQGWLDGMKGGLPVAGGALNAARDILLYVKQREGGLPAIFPLEDGGILLEWAAKEAVASIEISPALSFYMLYTRRGAGILTAGRARDFNAVKRFVEKWLLGEAGEKVAWWSSPFQ